VEIEPTTQECNLQPEPMVHFMRTFIRTRGLELFGILRQDLEPVQRKRPLGTRNIKMVGAKNLQVPQLIPHAKLVVCLKFVPVAGSTDALEVLPAVWVPCPKSPDKSCWHDVIYMAPRSSLPKIYAAQLNFAISVES